MSLGTCVGEAVHLLQAALPAAVGFRLALTAGDDTVQGDPAQLQQVVVNLCTNAAHALGEAGGTVEIELTELELDASLAERTPELRPGRHLHLTVSDAGEGMSPEVQQRIFEPFFTTKSVGQGTGLGLSAAHGIVSHHGGAISVVSSPGEGTTVHLIFPRCDRSEQAPQEHCTNGREHVLLVDDEEDMVMVVRQILEELGYRVTATYSSTEVLALLREDPEQFDILITDHAMPALTGLELAEAALALRPGLPVALCTGYSQARARERAKALGVARFLLKPITVNRLGTAIREALDGIAEEPPLDR